MTASETQNENIISVILQTFGMDSRSSKWQARVRT